MVSRAPSPRRLADADAAAWIARLNSESRDGTTEAALRAWLDSSADNRDAFERATEIWGLVPGAAIAAGEAPARAHERRAPRIRGAVLALAASLLLILAAGSSLWLLAGRAGHYSTSRGEQEMATLEDGSRISLNTDTSLSVRYEGSERRVRLDHGEAMFEVAPDRSRPFIVEAGGKQVRALGTSFIVRRDGSEVAVVLIEGRVAVEGAEPAAARAAPVVLAPGERLRAENERFAGIDRPSIEAATAWRRGQAVFDDASLADAVAEVNRYGGPTIVIADPRVASLRVSGVFATNDSGEFAQAVATLHGLSIEQRDGELRIGR